MTDVERIFQIKRAIIKQVQVAAEINYTRLDNLTRDMKKELDKSRNDVKDFICFCFMVSVVAIIFGLFCVCVIFTHASNPIK